MFAGGEFVCWGGVGGDSFTAEQGLCLTRSQTPGSGTLLTPDRLTPHLCVVCRRHSSLTVTVDPDRPRAIPELRFAGAEHVIRPLRDSLNRRLAHWCAPPPPELSCRQPAKKTPPFTRCPQDCNLLLLGRCLREFDLTLGDQKWKNVKDIRLVPLVS